MTRAKKSLALTSSNSRTAFNTLSPITDYDEKNNGVVDFVYVVYTHSKGCED